MDFSKVLQDACPLCPVAADSNVLLQHVLFCVWEDLPHPALENIQEVKNPVNSDKIEVRNQCVCCEPGRCIPFRGSTTTMFHCPSFLIIFVYDDLFSCSFAVAKLVYKIFLQLTLSNLFFISFFFFSL